MQYKCNHSMVQMFRWFNSNVVKWFKCNKEKRSPHLLLQVLTAVGASNNCLSNHGGSFREAELSSYRGGTLVMCLVVYCIPPFGPLANFICHTLLATPLVCMSTRLHAQPDDQLSTSYRPILFRNCRCI